VILAGAVLLGGLASAALAAPKDAPPSASVTVLAIRAAKEDREHMDPALAALADDLKKTASQFNAFRLLMQVPRSIAMADSQDLPLVEGYLLRVKHVGAAEETIELVIAMVRTEEGGKAREVFSTTLRLKKGKYMLLGGWKLKEGTLLTAISAR
jgi:hypothetical protein